MEHKTSDQLHAPAEPVTGLRAVQLLRERLAAAGLPRTSQYAGAELTGWTTSYGSTGFSIRRHNAGLIEWHLVVSGKPHLRYERVFDRRSGDEQHEPVNPEVLNARIMKVFEEMGLSVIAIRCSGWQRLWDDDVQFNVVTAQPLWLLND